MKKLLFFAAVAVFGIATSNAQGQFKGGASLGLPVGDVSDLYSFNVQLDATYLWEVADSFEAGATLGYSHSFAKTYSASSGGVTIEFKPDAAQFIPVAATGRYGLSDEFSVGLDLGYAIGVNDGNDGGLYYRPRVTYGISDSIDIVGSYTGVSKDGSSFNTITLGVEFSL
ncbi:MAG: outer membrane beta-barrel protein [Cellulophaga sp.]